jgi:hypothetical protein
VSSGPREQGAGAHQEILLQKPDRPVGLDVEPAVSAREQNNRALGRSGRLEQNRRNRMIAGIDRHHRICARVYGCATSRGQGESG